MRRMYLLAALFGAMVLGLNACDWGQPTANRDKPATATPSPSAPATHSQSPAAPRTSATPTPTGSPRPSRPAKPVGQTSALSLFYVALGDNGKAGERVGCGDSLVMDTTGPVHFTDQVSASFSRLLANHQRSLGQSGLYNALYQSRLRFVDYTKMGDVITIRLSGHLTSSGECDDPRMVAQLERTATVAAGTGHARVLVNDTPLRQLLSGR